MGIKISARGIANLIGESIKVVFPVAQEIVVSHVNDSIRLGDGTTLTGVTTNNELKTNDADAITQLTAIQSALSDIKSHTDTLESLISSSNALLTTIQDNADSVEPLLTSIRDNADDLETLTTESINRLGPVTETPPTSDISSSGINGRLQRIAQRVTSLITLFPISLGQKLMAESLAVTIASNQTALPASQSGLWTVQPGNTPNTTPWLQTVHQGGNSAIVTNSEPLPSSYGLFTRTLKPPTYSYGSGQFSPTATAATDICTIYGAASKVIKIKRVRVSGSTTSGSAVKVTVNVIKRSSVNTGGTFVAGSKVPHRSTNSASTATVGHYTANPTLGTTVGNIRSFHTSFQQASITTLVDFEFGENEGEPIYLLSASEGLAINLNATSIAGVIMGLTIEYEEFSV